MKKSLIALAVLAVSGASFAQSNVTVYGLADLWLGSSKTETSGDAFGDASLRQTKVDSGGVNTSRWGLKGSEDLGGGLKANFKFEQGFAMDTGAAGVADQVFSRQSWVGVSGGFGEVQLGRVWSTYDDINSLGIDTFGANFAAKYNVWLSYQDRPSNAIKYLTPTVSGFSGSLTYGLGEDKTDANDASRILSLGGQYLAGPLLVALTHQEQTQTGGSNSLFSAVPGILLEADFNLVTGLNPGFTGKTTYSQINGWYDFGVVKLIGAYNVVKQTVDSTPTLLGGDLKAKEYDLGVDVPLSTSLTLTGGYARSKVEGDGQDVFKTSGYTAALKYNLSKRTMLYGVLTQTKLDVAGTRDEAKASLYAVGVNHTF